MLLSIRFRLVYRAQYLGDLAPDEVCSDDSLRLGFQIEGLLTDRNDIDYYSFTAEAGTEIWFDIDRTRYGLDPVFELLDADGVLIAQSDNAQDETLDSDLLYQSDAIPAGEVGPGGACLHGGSKEIGFPEEKMARP